MLSVNELLELKPFEPKKIVKKLAFHEAGHASAWCQSLLGVIRRMGA